MLRTYSCEPDDCAGCREAGVTQSLARPHDQVYFHLPLSFAPFV